MSIVPTKPKEKQVGNKYLKKKPNRQRPVPSRKTRPEVVQQARGTKDEIKKIKPNKHYLSFPQGFFC